MKCILFDLDETLFDHRHSSLMGISALCDLYPGLLNTKTVEELEEESWNLLNIIYKDVLSGKITADEARIKRMASMFKGCGTEISEEKLDKLSEIYKDKYWKSIRAIPGIVDVLKRLKAHNYTIAVLTNGFKEMQMKKINGCGIEEYIDYVITSQEIGYAKPHPEIYIRALKMCKASAKDTIMIGDAWESDIVGAINAGIKAVWINRRNKNCPDPEAAQIIMEPLELLDIII